MRFIATSTRLQRRRRERPSRVRIGPRVFAFFIVSAVTLGAIAISMNLRLEDWEKTSSGSAD